MSVRPVTESSFGDFIDTADGEVLLEFYSDSCAHCKTLQPIVSSLADEEADWLTVGAVNASENPELAEQFDVRSVPTLVAIKDGREYNRTVGVHSKRAILEML